MIFAVDFDGTLCKEQWPGIGPPNMTLINYLIEARKDGNEVILWTMREEDALQEALDWCESFGLTFDAVNDNLERQQKKYGNNPRKISADWYIDDHNAPLGFMSTIKVPFEKSDILNKSSSHHSEIITLEET